MQADTVAYAWLLTLAGLVLALAWPMLNQLRGGVLESGSLIGHWAADRRARIRLARLGLVLAAIAALLVYPNVNSVLRGFVMLGLVLLAAAWLLPAVLTGVLQVIEWMLPKKSIAIRCLIGDGRAQLPALRTAMMAMLLAITANLGVDTMIGSFRDSFDLWLEQRLSADIYVQNDVVDKEGLLAMASNSDWLAASHRRLSVDLRWRDRPAVLRGLDPGAADTQALAMAKAIDNWYENWSGPAANAVLINEQAHYLGGIELGEELILSSDAGPKAYRVAGIFYDYGNSSYVFTLPFNEVASHWSRARDSGLALWLRDPGDRSQFEAAENALLLAGARPGDWIEQAQIKTISRTIFERTFSITAAMNILTLLVAGAALLTSLLAILQERMPQFAQWRALGLRSSELLALIAVPVSLFLIVTFLAAIPLGLLTSWLLIHKLNIVSFGWSMSMVPRAAPALMLGLIGLGIVTFSLAVVHVQISRRLPIYLARLGGTW